MKVFSYLILTWNTIIGWVIKVPAVYPLPIKLFLKIIFPYGPMLVLWCPTMVDILTFLGDGLTQKQTFCNYPYKDFLLGSYIRIFLIWPSYNCFCYFSSSEIQKAAITCKVPPTNQAIFKNYFSIWSHVSGMMPYDGGHLDILGWWIDTKTNIL
jgi:hypothetical protein